MREKEIKMEKSTDRKFNSKFSSIGAFFALIVGYLSSIASIFATDLASALSFYKKNDNKELKEVEGVKRVESNNLSTLSTSFNSFNSNNIRKTFTFFLALLLLLTPALATPSTFNIQGKLTDDGGSALSGTYNMTFKIYDAYTGGNIVWNTSNKSIATDSDGIYNVILTGINTTFGAQYYLGIEVMADGEMSPRINLTSTPYTFRANISEDLICTDCVDGSDLADTITLDANMNILAFNFSINNSDLFIDTTNARVGIGTTGPSDKLDVNSGNICLKGEKE